MEHILRIYIHETKASQQLDDILAYCKKTHCHEVMLMTTGYFTQPSFIPIEEIKSYTEKLIEWSNFLRKRGVEVSINVIQTLGHIFFPDESSREFPFQRQIVLDGTESISSACPLGEEYKKYIISAYGFYAQVKPRLLFVDDDFRFITGGGMGCFCPLHLKKLSESLGYEITFEELKKAIFSSSGSTHEPRKAFHEVLNNSMVELAKNLSSAVNEVSPDTRVGFMSSTVPHSTWGCDLDQIASAFAGQHRPLFRPQMPMYSEIELKLLPRCFSQPSYAREMFSPKVELYPEIENAYYTVFAKSAQIMFLQVAACMLNGMSNITILPFDWLGSPFSEGQEYIFMLSKKWKFFDALSKIIPEGCKSQGIGIPMHKHSTIVRKAFAKKQEVSSIIDPRHWDNYLPLLGLPVSFDWAKTPFIFLTGDDVLAYSEKELDSFIKRGVVMDIRAAKCLCSLGFSNRIGVKIGNTLQVDADLCLECFHTNTTTEFPNISGEIYIPQGENRATVMKKIEIIDRSKSKVLSSIINRKKEVLAPAVVAYENQQGERFGIIAYSPELDERCLSLNHKRKIQLAWLFAWVARQQLPISVHNAPYVHPVLQKINNKKFLCLINYSTDTYKSILVSLPWYSSQKYETYRLSRNGTLNKSANILHSKNGLWEILLNLHSADIEVIAFEKIKH